MGEAYYPVLVVPSSEQTPPPRFSAQTEGSAPDRLGTEDHSRDAAGLTYVYPVVSRRARGVSIGVNLNPNNACNWACVYCQVPNLRRGAAPPIDLGLLETELREFLALAQTEAWMSEHVPEGARRLNDIAFSGNGEPTTARNFDAIVGTVIGVRSELPHTLQDSLRTVLITNGSQMHRPEVVRGLEAMSKARGEVWFKVDRIGAAARRDVNGTTGADESVSERLRISAAACPTKIQTCMFELDGAPPSAPEVDAYVGFLESEIRAGVPLAGVLLYGLARPSEQPGADRLGRLDAEWLERLADEVRGRTGLEVGVHP